MTKRIKYHHIYPFMENLNVEKSTDNARNIIKYPKKNIMIFRMDKTTPAIFNFLYHTRFAKNRG